MSIEPQCIYCKAHDKFRCRSQEEANACKTYQRRRDAIERVRKPEPEIRTVSVEEIDKAIDTLTRLKKQIGDPDERTKRTR